MSQTFSLTPQKRAEFERRGVLRFEGLMSAERVRAAREHVQRRLERLGLWRDGAWRLEAMPRPRWPDRALKTRKVVGNKHPAVEALIEDPAVVAVVGQLLDGRRITRALHQRPQVLFTWPTAGGWRLPDGWHADGLRLASGRRSGVQMFACLDEVVPHGGGTLLLAGSYRLFDLGHHIRATEFSQLMAAEPFLRDLMAGRARGAGGDPSVMPHARVGDIELEVVEAIGAPGDAWFVDLRTLHAGAPNDSDRPRIMATHRFVCSDVVKEIVEAMGWA